MAYQHRYIQYSFAHRRDPDTMLAYDRERWIGGCMCGFLLWGRRASQAFAQENGGREFGDVELKLGVDETRRRYDDWLVINRGRFVEAPEVFHGPIQESDSRCN